jgi:hypothetical protein
MNKIYISAFITAALVASFIIVLMVSPSAEAQDKVKYCKNYTTGEIITVTAGMPCPYPTSEI